MVRSSGTLSLHNPHHPMNFKSALAATALAVISTTSALAISTPAQAADGCGRGWRYSHSYGGCVVKRHRRPVYVPVSRRYSPIYRRSIYRPGYRNVYSPSIATSIGPSIALTTCVVGQELVVSFQLDSKIKHFKISS